MRSFLRHTQQQYEGQEHEFLAYRFVHVYFIYSFAWDSDTVSWRGLCEDLTSKVSQSPKGWILPRLHDRVLHQAESTVLANYQPSLVSARRVLERNGIIQERATVILQRGESLGSPNEATRPLTIGLRYTVRMFDNGAGTCTFHALIEKQPNDGNERTFENIHAVLHLSRNVDYDSPERSSCIGGRPPSHLTDSYLVVPQEDTSRPEEDHTLFPPSTRYCSLQALFRRFLDSPPPWAPREAPQVWADRDVLDHSDPRQDFQSPFIVTVAEVERQSFLRFRKHPTLDAAREVASIFCKLTLDNRSILEDYLHLSEDYITEVLDYNADRKGLINYCLDRRLFFAFSKRGAIAITASLKDLPSCFVAPSLLNLLEITRARWHMCCVLNMKIDSLIDSLSSAMEGAPLGSDSLLGPDKIELLLRLRRLYTLFLRDPIPYLFDGGSVTEIAKKAIAELDMDTLSEGIHRKMEVLDFMRQDIEEKQRQERRMQFDQEWQRTRIATEETPNV
jgi:hypothetical protein